MSLIRVCWKRVLYDRVWSGSKARRDKTVLCVVCLVFPHAGRVRLMLWAALFRLSLSNNAVGRNLFFNRL